MSLDPGVILGLVAAEALYLRAVHVLGARGYHVPLPQRAFWHAGITLLAVALIGPFDPLGEELLSMHMAQHLLIADLAAPLLLVGMRSPVLQFLLPRPALVAVARRRGLRRAFRTLRRPAVALPLWAVTLYAWHHPALFEAALRDPLVHGLEHQTFIVTSLLVWWPALEPKRRRTPGELWKMAYILGARVTGMFLGVALIALREPVYDGFYGDAPREHGLSPLADQQIAGGMMLSLDVAITMFALAFFFWRASQDADRAEQAALAAR